MLTIQRHLLPAALPVPSGARLAAHYLVADADLDAGGDWFEAMMLSDGRVALAVGDVVGHGPGAAAAMSRLRPVLQDALRSGAGIEQAVARLDAFAAGSPATRAATLSLAVLHPASGLLQHAPGGPAEVPDLVCAVVVERMTRAGQQEDVTVLAAHVLSAPTPAWASSIGEVTALPELRAELTGWLDELGATALDVRTLELAVSEVATNALVHGHHQHATVDVSADLDDRGTVQLCVTDRGHWVPEDADRLGSDRGSRGRGLALIRAIVDELDVATGTSGTTVTMRHSLRHATSLGHHAGSTRRARTPPAEFAATAHGSVLAVRGAVDVTTADALRSAIMRTGRGGTRQVTVDLSRTTLLSGAGVRLLHDLTRALRRWGEGTAEPIRLIAPAGSPARDVLTLTGLEHLVADA